MRISDWSSDVCSSDLNSTYTADGNVRYQDSSMRMVAESAHGDQTRDTHQIDAVRDQLIERRGNGGSDSIRMDGTQGALMGSTCSTCTPDDRPWALRAARLDLYPDPGFGTPRTEPTPQC